MKKQLFLFAAVSLISTQIDASAAQRKAKLRAEIAKGSAGAGAVSSGGTQFGPAEVITQAQMQAAVAKNPADALAACQKAIADINLEPSGTPDATVLSYING